MKYATWEVDFFKHEIFNEKTNFIYFDSMDIDNMIEDQPCALIISIALTFPQVLKLVQNLKPNVIFHLSDELGDLSHWLDLAKQTKVMFRQYNHPQYNYDKNSFQMPLGYVRNFLSGSSFKNITFTNMKDRIYTCSFVGQVKSDRAYMCHLFEQNMKNTMIICSDTNWSNPEKSKITPPDMFKIYGNSIFVLIGRGNASLDCFRIYEALASGAIPVVVGSNDEIMQTFHHNGNYPHFVISENWDIALNICQDLLPCIDKLNAIQDYNKNWWNSQILFIQEKIRLTLGQ